ncbi:NAD(P)-dependent oxidoreductase [Mucilaginibacter calamicampi]|uniref:NAD(P)-dependent oxidoreductase n=1 Tax=Mucilaginibacter calamicampi TaxID=1302352 RepID=A0ABW2YT93_9SPHI
MIDYRHMVVLGANGGIGKQVVMQALIAGYEVTAILRTPDNLTIQHPNLKVVQGDVMRAGTLYEHLKGKDVVISAIGQNSLKTTTLYSQGSKNLIASMERTGVKRAFFISASGLDVNPKHPLWVRFATKYLLQMILRNPYADQRIMENIIKQSAVQWTISTNGFLDNGWSISRADVAHFIVHNLANPVIINQTVEVAY